MRHALPRYASAAGQVSSWGLTYGRARPPVQTPGIVTPTLVTVTPIVWQAGLEQALVAVAISRSRGAVYRYRIEGTGPLEEQVRFAIQDMRLQDWVTLSEGTQATSALHGVEGYLHTELVELAGTGLGAARSCGLPLVRTDVRSPGADRSEWERVVGPWDPPAMAEALLSWRASLR
jgi:glycosyltransferase involved in cell wall biosynthesis